MRQVCGNCSAVSIDLTGAHEGPTAVVSENTEIITLVTGKTDEP